MICGICKTEGVSIAHVKDCSKGKPFDGNRWPTPEDDKLAMQQVGLAPEKILEQGDFVRYESDLGLVFYYAVVVSRSGYPYVKRWDEETSKWVYAKGEIRNLQAQPDSWEKMSLEDAVEFGHAFGCCMVCGATHNPSRPVSAPSAQGSSDMENAIVAFLLFVVLPIAFAAFFYWLVNKEF